MKIYFQILLKCLINFKIKVLNTYVIKIICYKTEQTDFKYFNFDVLKTIKLFVINDPL